jgi:cyclopropane-fatty-acyl-phospholipid synthase
MNTASRRSTRESRSVGLGAGEFIEKYVFPDGEVPHLSLVIKEMGQPGSR